MFCWRWRNPSSKLVKVTMEVKTLLIWLIDISRQIKIHQQSLLCCTNPIFSLYFLHLPLDFMNFWQQNNYFLLNYFDSWMTLNCTKQIKMVTCCASRASADNKISKWFVFKKKKLFWCFHFTLRKGLIPKCELSHFGLS